jgi:hypothetical protein
MYERGWAQFHFNSRIFMRAGSYPRMFVWTQAQNSQFKFRFLDYSPQPKDVIYGYPEVTTSGSGTDRKL